MSDRALRRLRSFCGYAAIAAVLLWLGLLALGAPEILSAVCAGVALVGFLARWWFANLLEVRRVAASFADSDPKPDRAADW